ncbi:MAG TPA: Uma2 family endonuclease [Pyrinomonadaceae bacterium]|nr:Uma2 family endonuclease [Pyrinomonadaceae bacterium]
MARTHSHADQLIPPHLIGLTRPVSHREFEQLCREYPDLRLELTSSGELIVMPPTGLRTGTRNADLTYQLTAWTKNDRSGVCFDSNTAFTLPNGAIRSPDGSWMSRMKWDSISDFEKDRFSHVCPDFVVELRSGTDSLRTLFQKMEEYITNGATLGWLIDPQAHRVYVYRAAEEPIVLEDPTVVSGEPLLHGFELQMEEIWAL